MNATIIDKIDNIVNSANELKNIITEEYPSTDGFKLIHVPKNSTDLQYTVGRFKVKEEESNPTIGGITNKKRINKKRINKKRTNKKRTNKKRTNKKRTNKN